MKLGITLKNGKPVDDDGKPITLHRIRSSFYTACENAELPKKTSEVLAGHAGENVAQQVYNSGPEFHRLAAYMAKVWPLA